MENNEETTQIIETTTVQDVSGGQYSNMESSLLHIEVMLWILLCGLASFVVLKVFYKILMNFV